MKNNILNKKKLESIISIFYENHEIIQFERADRSSNDRVKRKISCLTKRRAWSKQFNLKWGKYTKEFGFGYNGYNTDRYECVTEDEIY